MFGVCLVGITWHEKFFLYLIEFFVALKMKRFDIGDIFFIVKEIFINEANTRIHG